MMKHINYNYQVITNIVLTREEIVHLQFLANKHYDHKCKAAGEVGGFIYGWETRFNYEHDLNNEIEISATIRELDIVSKILEIESTFHVNSRGSANLKISMSKQLNEIAQNACQESERINRRK